MHKKGQAAMEFLMTYGWAILAAIIAIGVLAYFGVFSPGKYAPSATVVNPPFYAVGATVSDANGVSIELQNNGGELVNVWDIVVGGCQSYTDGNQTIAAGSSEVFNVPCNSVEAGNSFKGDLTVVYTRGSGQLNLTSTGTISQQAVA